MSKTTKIIISIIVIVFVGYAGWWTVAFNGGVNNSSVVPTLPKDNDVVSTTTNVEMNTTTTGNTQTETAQWKTYQNITMGFEVKYPADWYVIKEYDGAVFSNVESSERSDEYTLDESYFGISLEGGNGQLPIKNWFEKEVAFVMDPKSVEFVTVDGHPAVRAKPSEGVGERLNYYIASGDDVIRIVIEQEQEKFFKAYEYMLSTFKFLR